MIPSPGRKKDYSSRIKSAAAKRWAPEMFEADARQTTLAILSEGFPFEATKRFCQKICVKTLERWEYDKIVEEIGPKIEHLAQCSCQEALHSSTSHGVAHDGSWNAKRNAQHLFFTIIALDTNKVIYYLVVSKMEKVSMLPFNGKASNAMESVAIEAAKKWLEEQTDITFRVCDLDVNSQKYFEDVETDEAVIQCFFDPGHMKNHIKKEFESYRKTCQCGNIANYIADRFAYCVSQEDISVECREQMWLNSVSYFISPESNIPESINPLIKGFNKKCSKNYIEPSLLMKNTTSFLEKYAWTIRKCSMGRTCACEAINALKARVSPKGCKTGYDFRVKMAITVLMWNDPLHFYEKICEACDIPPICEELYEELTIRTEKKYSENIKRSTKEYHIKRAIKKREKKPEYLRASINGHTLPSMPKIEAHISRKDTTRNIPSTMLPGIEDNESCSAFSMVLQFIFNSEFCDLLYHFNAKSDCIQCMCELIRNLKNNGIVNRDDLQKTLKAFDIQCDAFFNVTEAFKRVFDRIEEELIENESNELRQCLNSVVLFYLEKSECSECCEEESNVDVCYVLDFETDEFDTVQKVVSNMFTTKYIQGKCCCCGNDCIQKQSTFQVSISSYLLISLEYIRNHAKPMKLTDISLICAGQEYIPFFIIKHKPENHKNKKKSFYCAYLQYNVNEQLAYFNGVHCYKSKSLSIESLDNIAFIVYKKI